MSKDQEYISLRDELKESKKYVFERPILSIMAIIAFAQFVKESYVSLLPSVTVSIMIYNLWFTINRLKSSSRIAAYIQVYHEPPDKFKWIGWENFLRCQRAWLKITGKKNTDDISKNLPKIAVPDALFYYPAIYNLHIFIVLFCLVSSILFYISNPSDNFIILNSALTVLLSLYFFKYALSVLPSKMRVLIEQNRKICEQVSENIDNILSEINKVKK